MNEALHPLYFMQSWAPSETNTCRSLVDNTWDVGPPLTSADNKRLFTALGHGGCATAKFL